MRIELGPDLVKRQASSGHTDRAITACYRLNGHDFA
jgi:hypothetical protein